MPTDSEKMSAYRVPGVIGERSKRRLVPLTPINGPSLLWRHGAQIGDDGAEVGIGHAGIPLKTHGRLEVAAVLADSLGDGPLDFGVAPRACALLPVRRDIAGDRFSKRAVKRLTAPAKIQAGNRIFAAIPAGGSGERVQLTIRTAEGKELIAAETKK
jgi:hypothetical protein